MKRILIVDDDVNTVTLLEKKLVQAGYEVLTAYNGVDGLKKIRQEKPDLAILDIVMPGLDGYSVFKEIKADDSLRDVHLIIMTAKSHLKEIFMAEGACIFEKPFKPEELFSKIDSLLK